MTLSWISTTPQMDTIVGLRKFHLPYGFGLVLALALRLIPTFSNELHIIYEANQVRGVNFSSKSVITKLKSTIGLMIPIVTSSLRQIVNIGNALDARGYKAELNPQRTYLRDPKMGRNDYFVVIAFTLLTIVTVVAAMTGVITGFWY